MISSRSTSESGEYFRELEAQITLGHHRFRSRKAW